MINIIKKLKASSTKTLKKLEKEPTDTKQGDSKKGDYAESIALKFLKHQDLKFLQRNFNCKAGEIDLIFKEQNCVVFVEVRYRKNSYYGSPAATVDDRKQQKVVRAALTYLQRKKYSIEETAFRFDVIQLLPAPKSLQATNPDSGKQEHSTVFEGHQILWIKSAFTG